MRKIGGALLSLIVVLFAMGSAYAGASHAQVFKDCPRKADLQGHLNKYSVPADKSCGSRWQSFYAYEDTRLGMHFSGPTATSLVPIGVSVVPAAEDPADKGVLCTKLFPDGAVLERIVEPNEDCDRVEWNKYARRYYNGWVFVFPANYGMAIKDLTLLGQQRANDTIATARAQQAMR